MAVYLYFDFDIFISGAG